MVVFCECSNSEQLSLSINMESLKSLKGAIFVYFFLFWLLVFLFTAFLCIVLSRFDFHIIKIRSSNLRWIIGKKKNLHDLWFVTE